MLFSQLLLLAEARFGESDGYFAFGLFAMILLLIFGPGIYEIVRRHLKADSSESRCEESDADLPLGFYQTTCPECGSARASGELYDSAQGLDLISCPDCGANTIV
jgi:DNA-directed RNA polymerase subunit RPC12/RpoP